ncbi:MAG: LicD family protein [Clostridia bacterium]|nr:LicD family protein [Clostridia bacterium]
MVELTVEELKKCQAEALKEVHDYCIKNGIKYYMVYGTLLGAVRHKGYIPWDDDIDIAMPRADYERFIKEFNSSNSDAAYVVDISNNSDYYLDFAKVCHKNTVLIEHVYKPTPIGAYIDLFPLDFMPESEEQRAEFSGKLFKLKKKLVNKNYTPPYDKNNPLKIAAHIVVRTLTFASRKKTIKKIDELRKTYINNNTGLVEIAPGAFLKNVNSPSFDSFGEPILIQFEEYMFCAPKDYDFLLKKWYGDYMTPPPEAERVSHHGFKVYWKNS